MTAPSAPLPIVVGVDSSRSASHAVRWAAREAARQGTPLRLVHVCALVPAGYSDPDARLSGYADVLIEHGRQVLREATDAARTVAGTVEVGTDLRDGTITKVLVEESRNARLIVLGTRGLGGFNELFVGPVSVTLAAHAHCPVVVTRSSTLDAPPPETGPVVVGVDGSPLSDAAVAFALEAASSRAVPLLAVHSWLDVEPTAAWTPLPSIVDREAVHADEDRVFAERLGGWQDKYPTVEVRRVVSADHPARALLQAAGNAQLVVVGSRGRGALTGLGLGSVSQHLLHHAPCPVAVVRRAHPQLHVSRWG
jgi:nucleotide-binding universal stress UspA family protein